MTIRPQQALDLPVNNASCIFFNVYFWERDRVWAGGGDRERERGRHRIWSRLQALSCQHRGRRGAQTHGPQDHDLRWSQTLNQLSHPGAPISCVLLIFSFSPSPHHCCLSLFSTGNWQSLCSPSTLISSVKFTPSFDLFTITHRIIILLSIFYYFFL